MRGRLFAYCTPQSIVAGESVRLHASIGEATTVTVTVTRIGAERVVVAGHAVLGAYRHEGGGTVLTTGCTDWTHRLAARDPGVERITRNVLETLG